VSGRIKIVLAIPSVSSVGWDGSFTVQIAISDVTDLSACNLDIDYNATVLAAQSVSEDVFLLRSEPTIFFWDH
jgi:Cohesin domain